MKVVLAMVMAGLVALPLGASAQAGEEAVPKVALAIHTQHRLPPQLMLRASYYLYLDADADNGATSDQSEPNAEEPKSAQAGEEDSSRLERWHPEAFVDPSKPSSEPAPEEPDVDMLSQRAIEHYESLSEEEKKHERRRRRGLAIGVPIAVAVVVAVVVVGAAGASYARSD